MYLCSKSPSTCTLASCRTQQDCINKFGNAGNNKIWECNSFLPQDPTIHSACVRVTLPQSWQQIGLKGFGVITQVSLSKTNPNHILFSTEYAGAYQSVDKGVTWTKINNLPSSIVTQAVIDPNSDTTLYALVAYSKIYKSTNSGKDWTLVHSNPNTIGIFPEQGQDDVDLSISSMGIISRTKDEFIISKDGGVTWKNVTNLLSTHGNRFIGFQVFFHKMKIQPSGSGLISQLSFPTSNANQISSLLYKTVDGGAAWNLIFNVTAQFPGYQISSYDLNAVNGIVIVLHSENQNEHTLFITSLDGGVTWTSHKITNFYNAATQDIHIDDDQLKDLSSFVYIVGLSHFRLDAASSSYSYIYNYYYAASSSEEAFPWDLRYGGLVALKNGAGQIYFMPTDQGLYAFDTASKKMNQFAKDLSFAQQFTVSSDACGTIYYGLWHDSQYREKRNGFSTIKKIGGSYSGEGYGYFVNPDKNSCSPPLLFRKPFGWGYFPDGTNSDTVTESKLSHFSGISKDRLGSIPIYHKNHWYLISNEGGTLTEFDDTFSSQKAIFNHTSSFYFDNEDTLWILDTGFADPRYGSNTLYKKSITDTQFSKVPTTNLATSSFNPHAPSLVVHWPSIIIGNERGFFVSNDGGKSWKRDFDYNEIVDMVFVPNCNKVYASVFPGFGHFNSDEILPNQKYGVWESADFGQTWKRAGAQTDNELETVSTGGLYYDQWQNRLLVGTLGNGAWQLDLNGVC